MAGYNYNFNAMAPSTSIPTSAKTFIPARVVDVILDDSHPEYERYGKWSSIGIIKYRVLNKQIEESSPESLPTAYPLQSHIKHIPLKNEIVLILASPSEQVNSSSSVTKNYYLDIVNLWNHPHHNALPLNTTRDIQLGDEFVELADINPMQPFEGDIIFEGRQGQSVRFSTATGKTPWTGTNGSPITIISNGQVKTDNGFEYITENVNSDSTSIYLTSNQGIDLNFARDFNISTFETSKYYNSSQFIANSDRIVINAKKDDVVITSAAKVGLSSKEIYIESGQNTTLDSQRINLGEKANESVLLGDYTLTRLSSVLTQLIALSTGLSSIGIPQVTAPAQELIRTSTEFIANIAKMKSNKVKVSK